MIQCGGPIRTVFDINPKGALNPELSLWMWGNKWIRDLEWDPKDCQWRRIGNLADISVLNYTTKRGYRVALRQNNHAMKVDAEIEAPATTTKQEQSFLIEYGTHIYLEKSRPCNG